MFTIMVITIIISKIRVKLPFLQFRGKNNIYAISEAIIIIVIVKLGMFNVREGKQKVG